MLRYLHRLLTIGLAIVLSSSLARAQQTDPPKVIIDTDFNTMGDDGQVAVMAAHLYSKGAIDLLGFTIASGNQWRDQEVSDSLKAMERLGLEHRVKVYVGSQYPLLHNYQSYLYEQLSFGAPIDYVGAYAAPQPDPNQCAPQLESALAVSSAAVDQRLEQEVTHRTLTADLRTND